MPKSIRDIKLDWTWDGDIENLKGFNVALCHSAQTPLTSTAAFATVIDPTKRSYIFKNQICSIGLEYEGFVQAVYSDIDSDWISTGSVLTVPDDGVSTVAQKREVDIAQYTANKKTITYSQSSPPEILDDTHGDIWFDTDNSNRPYRCADNNVASASFVRSSNAWILGSAVSNNIPRYENGKFGQALRIEEAITNLADYSDNMSYGASTVTATLNTDISPSGILDADTVSDNNNSLTGAWYKSVVVTPSSNKYTWSIYVKKHAILTSYPAFMIRFVSGGTDQQRYFILNPVSGIIANTLTSGNSNATCTIKDCGEYWRVALTASDTDATPVNLSTRLYIYPAFNMSGSTVSSPSAIGSVVLWGVQCEANIAATTYIPTSSAAVTRSAESVTLPVSSYLNSTAGTISGWFYQDNISSSGWSEFFNIGDNIRCYITSSYGATVGSTAIVSTKPFKEGWTHIALTWTSSRAALYIDGVLVKAENISVSPTISSTLCIGGYNDNIRGKINGLVEGVRLYQRALGDSEIFTLYKYKESQSDLCTFGRFDGSLNFTKLDWVLTEDLRVTDIVSDGVFSPVEKQATRKEWEVIYLEKLKFVSQATSFSLTSDVAYTTYISKYQALANYLNGGSTWTEGATPPLWISDINIATSTNITAAAFRAVFKDFYDAKQGLLNRFDTYASTKANWNGIPDIPTRFGETIPAIGNGIVMTPTWMGYYTNGGSISSYIKNDGTFKFYGDANNFIEWNGSALNVKGKVTITSGSSGWSNINDRPTTLNALDSTADSTLNTAFENAQYAVNRSNLTDTSWWNIGVLLTSKWAENSSYGATSIFESGTNSYGTSGILLKATAGDSGTNPLGSSGGWNNGLAIIDTSKTYRFAVAMRPSLITGTPGTMYWGITSHVCTLNTTTAIGNPYFASLSRVGLDQNKWYLFVGYVYPYGSTGHTNDGAGIWDMSSGKKITGGNNYNWMNLGSAYTTYHRAYQYYATVGNVQHFDRPQVHLCDGSEPLLVGKDVDRTQTVIDGGIVTTGRLEVGNGVFGSANAGINGSGTSSSDIRFWAGNTYANRASAPFRVDQAGNLVATNATITGNVTATSGSFTGSITSTSGSIGGWTIGASSLSSNRTGITSGGAGNGIWIGTDGISLGSTAASPAFKVTSAGAVTASNIAINGGSITWSNLNKPTKSDLGTWTTNIDTNGIYTGTLNANQVNTSGFTAQTANIADNGVTLFSSSIWSGGTINPSGGTWVFIADSGLIKIPAGQTIKGSVIFNTTIQFDPALNLAANFGIELGRSIPGYSGAINNTAITVSLQYINVIGYTWCRDINSNYPNTVGSIYYSMKQMAPITLTMPFSYTNDTGNFVYLSAWLEFDPTFYPTGTVVTNLGSQSYNILSTYGSIEGAMK